MNTEEETRDAVLELTAAAEENPTEEEDIQGGELSPEDPLALYREYRFAGKPETRTEAFRRFAIRNRRAVYSLLLAGVVLPFVWMMTTRQPESPEELIRSYFARVSSADEATAYAIGDARVTARHVRQLYQAVLKFTWGQKGADDAAGENQLFEAFVREQFETDLLVNAALKEGRFRSTDARLILENAVRHAAADYYLYTRIAAADSNFRIRIPREQVLSVYEKNKEFYARQGFNKAAALPVIEQSIVDVKRAEMALVLSRAREQVLADLKDRSGTTVQGSTKK